MISIIARPSYLGNYYPHHSIENYSLRLSSRIRGDEIAKYINAKLYPKRTVENDVYIHVKPMSLNEVRDGDYVDYLDGGKFALYLSSRPKVKVIAASQNSFEVLKKELPNEIVFIPCHHLNWDNIRREKQKVTTAGYLGNPSPIAMRMYGAIQKKLKEIGIEFVFCYDYKTRQDAIDFYKKIDILVVGAWELGDTNPHKIPTKLINAASFGIPSVAYPWRGYKEIEGYYIQANNMRELISGVEKLKDETCYNQYADRIITMAENYHISRIAEFYKKL
jgi:hypothetical protein